MNKPDIEVYRDILDNRTLLIGGESDLEKIAESYEEMIDALMDLMQEYEDKGQLLGYDVSKARKALKKAGVEL